MSQYQLQNDRQINWLHNWLWILIAQPTIRVINHHAVSALEYQVHLLIALHADIHFCETLVSAQHARKCTTC